MATFKSIFGSLDISSRPKRRRAVDLIITELGHIRSAEESYMDRVPDSLQGGDIYAAAEASVDLLAEAIDALCDAYYQ